MADLKLPQKLLRENLFKRLITRLVLLAFLHQNLAFATNINLDFKDSQTPQRLHVIPRLSNVGDVSHVGIDIEKRQVNVYRVDATQLTEEENVPSLVHPDAIKKHPVIVPAYDVQNLPWDLEPEKLTLFILNHTAWLSPLDKDGYKLEFRGALLGGMMKGGGGKKELVVEVTQFTVDCKGRNDYPSGTIGERFCNKNGNGSGGSGINVINVSGTGRGGSSQGTSSGWQGILGQGWAKIKENGDKARDRMQKQQENLKKLSTVGQSVEIYKRPEIIIPDSPFPRVQTYQPSTKEPFQTGSSLEDQYSRLRVLYNMADRWEWWSIYEYAKVIGVSREEIKKYNLTQRHAKRAGFSLEYFKEVTEEEERNALKKKQQEEEEREKARQYEQESSRVASSLFDNVPPQYKVTPEYFEQSASDAGMMPSQALHIILNPTSENFYDRTILTSRQNWLGGAKNTIAFVFEDLTNGQAYKYISQGYKFGDFPTLSNRLVSQRGATLFENVTPDYFVKQTEKAGMTPFQALKMIFNPTPENFYDRVMLTSRQNWLGGSQDKTAFALEGLTNGQAYKYISQGYHKGDTATISNKLISERWDIETGNPFDDQVLEDWGAKDWREVFHSTGEDAEFIQVGGKVDLIKEILKFGAQKGGSLLKQGWQKAVQAYKGDLVKGLKIDKSVETKLTQELGKPYLSRDAKGLRWGDIKGNNQVRIMKGDPSSDFLYQQKNYVQLRSGGKVVLKDGTKIDKPITGQELRKLKDAHIPYEEWIKWKGWNQP